MPRFPKRYIPDSLSVTDRKKQRQMLIRSQKAYRKGKYYTRKHVASYPHKPSKHLEKARRIYGIDHIIPSRALAIATGCSQKALSDIVKKGEGAYYSSGSRPNQTPQSWGYARLASAITAGKAAAIDFDILKKGCHPKKKAFLLANRTLKKPSV